VKHSRFAYPDRLKIGCKTEKRPESVAEWLAMMRRALERAPLKPQIEDVPFDGGLVGTTGYDVVRFFERLPPNHAGSTACRKRSTSRPSRCSCSITSRVASPCRTPARNRIDKRCASVVNALRGGLDAAQRGTKFGPPPRA
jgi:hypothetical protein